MRLKRVHLRTRNTAGRHYARRARRWRLIPVSAAAALVLGCVATVAALEATATGGAAVGAQPERSKSRAPAARGTGVVDPAVKAYLNPKLLSAVPVGPGAVSKPVQAVLTSATVTTALDEDGIPEVALEAYQHTAGVLAVTDPSCQLPWELLAGIGRVESDDGRFGGSMLLPNGDTTKPIYGIPLDGRNGVALVRDTDHGKIDGDPNFDRAVGPMQFIPSTWEEYGVDGNGDGKKDINNIFDAALAAGDYLCAGGGNMSNPAQEAAAVRRYNDADEYVRVVLALAASYEHGGAATVPATAGPVGNLDSGSGFTPGLPNEDVPAPVTQPSSPHIKAPAPTRTPVQAAAPARAPTSQPTPTSPAKAKVKSTPTTIESPSAPATTAPTTTAPSTSAPTTTAPSTTVPATPTTTATTEPGPTPSCPPATTTDAPSGDSTTTVPATSTTTATTQPGPAPSCQPGQAPIPRVHPGQTADIGWAPAMRQVVVRLLSAPKTPPTRPAGPKHPGPQPADAVRRPGAAADKP